MNQLETVTRPRGRPRDPQVEHDVIAAALEHLSDVGFMRFSVESVAVLSGVSKAAIYRRFSNREQLITASLARLNDDLPAIPQSGSAIERLSLMLGRIRSGISSSLTGRIMMHVVGEGQRQPELTEVFFQQVLKPRRSRIIEVLNDGIRDGEFNADLDVDSAVAVLVGPMIYSGMWDVSVSARQPDTESILAVIMAGLAPANRS
jgi:AcrR family transcriptional regulator